jgi:hypothetical protein
MPNGSADEHLSDAYHTIRKLEEMLHETVQRVVLEGKKSWLGPAAKDWWDDLCERDIEERRREQQRKEAKKLAANVRKGLTEEQIRYLRNEL